MYKYLLLGFIMMILFTAVTNAQIRRTEVRRIYEEAERLYNSGNYTASLEYLKKESGPLINTSDSLIYLKIMSLENLYRTDFQKTTDLESTFKLFFARANKYSFPEIKYSEVSRVFTVFQGFREKDRIFYDSVSRVMDLNNPERLPSVRNAITDYQKLTPNTYYSKEFTAYVASIDNKLNELATIRKKQLSDSTYRERLKAVGKKITINAAFSIPTTTSGNFIPLRDKNDIINFFNGTNNNNLGVKYALNFSLGDALINLATSNRFKIALNWSVFDGEFTKMDWSPDTLLLDKETSGNEITNMTSVKAGTRMGLIAVVMLSKRMAAGFYYSARPGIQFLMRKMYFRVLTGGPNPERYEIKPEIADFNLSHEFGLKIFFFEKLFINVFIHTGNYSWKNSINNLSLPNSGSINTEAKYPFRHLGFRIGF